MKPTCLFLNSRDEFLRIDISRIAYFEADGNYTNIILANGLKGIVCMNLAKMKEVLEASLKEKAAIFARIGKKYIINLGFVFKVDVARQNLVLSDGISFAYTLSLSKDALKNLKDLFVTSISSGKLNNEYGNLCWKGPGEGGDIGHR